MTGIYLHRWTAAAGEVPSEGPAGALWARGLRGLTDAQVRHGIAACVASGDDWPPSLPAFRAMCLDIPTLAAVRAAMRGPAPEALRRFLALVWSHLDGYRLRQAPAEKADRMIADAYSLARDAVLRGEPLPDMPDGAIEAPRERERAPASPEVARAALDAIQGALGVAPATATECAYPECVERGADGLCERWITERCVAMRGAAAMSGRTGACDPAGGAP